VRDRSSNCWGEGLGGYMCSCLQTCPLFHPACLARLRCQVLSARSLAEAYILPAQVAPLHCHIKTFIRQLVTQGWTGHFTDQLLQEQDICQEQQRSMN